MSRSRDFDSRPAKHQLGGELAQLFDLLDRGGVRARSRPGPGACCGASSGYRGLMRDICGRRPAVPAASHAATWQRGS